MRRRPKRDSARLLLANLHATSNPAVVLPWLVALALSLRIDAVLLQECTDRHARWLARLPRWELVRDGGDEAILGRRRLLDEAQVIPDVSGVWLGKHTGKPHEARTLPLARLRGWLTIGSVHFPPGWVGGPKDRRLAGRLYLVGLRMLSQGSAPMLLGGDYNAPPTVGSLARWRAAREMVSAGGTIDHIAARGVGDVRVRRLGMAPGMDHSVRLVVVKR